jgi:DNA-binding MarR family transcriptional regulator
MASSRTLMKLGQQAIPKGPSQALPASVLTVLLDVIENPDTSISEIALRTGFPQSLVSGSVARLQAVSGALKALPDPKDRRRTLVRAVANAADALETEISPSPVDRAIAAALADVDPAATEEVITALELLARRLTPQALARLRSPLITE